MDKQQSEQLVLAMLGDASLNDPSSLVNMLKSSGYNATSGMSQDQLLTMSLKAMKDSNKFKSMLSTYLQNKIKEAESTSSFTGNESFLNTTGNTSWLTDTLKDTAKTAIPQIVNGGIQYGSAKLQANANKGSEQRALDLAREQTKQAQANVEAARLASQSSASSGGATSGGGTSKPKWVVPTIIGASVLVLGVVIYFAMKKKK